MHWTTLVFSRFSDINGNLRNVKGKTFANLAQLDNVFH